MDTLKERARWMRKNMTDAERCLWRHLRRDQVLGVRFYRQRPVGRFILDFYAPRIQLAVEADGGQHFDATGVERDRWRTRWLQTQGISVLRYDNRQILLETEAVIVDIFRHVQRLID